MVNIPDDVFVCAKCGCTESARDLIDRAHKALANISKAHNNVITKVEALLNSTTSATYQEALRELRVLFPEDDSDG